MRGWMHLRRCIQPHVHAHGASPESAAQAAKPFPRPRSTPRRPAAPARLRHRRRPQSWRRIPRVIIPAANLPRQGQPADARDRLLAGRVNIQHQQAVRIRKCRGELIHQQIGARVAVRLKNNVDAPVSPSHCRAAASVAESPSGDGRSRPPRVPRRRFPSTGSGGPLRGTARCPHECAPPEFPAPCPRQSPPWRSKRCERPGTNRSKRPRSSPLKVTPKLLCIAPGRMFRHQVEGTEIGIFAPAVAEHATLHPRQQIPQRIVVRAGHHRSVKRHLVHELHKGSSARLPCRDSSPCARDQCW